MFFDELYRTDPDVYEAIYREALRQHEGLELIASENFVSLAVLTAMGSVMTNKYAEGYPRKRYYGGCEFVDVAEELARERAKRLFNVKHANVQPHSGTQANMAVYFAVLRPCDTILAMRLDHGGHLSHGAPVNFAGKLYKVQYYGVDPETGRIDYDLVRSLAKKHRPQIIVTGYSAYPREIDFKAFREIADEVGAYLMADIAHIAGLVAAGVHPSPVPYAHFITTTTHKTLRGPRGAMIMTDDPDLGKMVDKSVFPGMQGGPLMHVIAAKAVAFKEALQPSFKEYAKQIVRNAKALAESLMENGLRLVSGGTDNHLMLVDLRNLGISGKKAERVLGEVGITVNKNTVPDDPLPPTRASGIRIGTPALTTRGMRESEMREIGRIIAEVLKNLEDEGVKEEARKKVRELTEAFPLYVRYRKEMERYLKTES